MKLKHIAAALMIGAATLPAMAQQGLDNPMTKAMMEVYEKELASNPGNAEVLYRRASEYYRFNQYLRALADADGAIKNAPDNDRDFRAAAYQLRGEIYQMLGKYAEALADFTESLKADPASFMALYQKANCEYELGDYAAAKADYTRLRAHNQRGVEALTGLARVAVQENNLGIAQSYMDDAVAMMRADSDIYVRRASVRRAMGNNTGAVDDLVMAISIDSNNRAFQELVNIADADYPAVVTGLGNAIAQAPEQGMFYYIRGVIAQAHAHYPAAIADYRKIIDDNLYNYAGLYNSLAECYLALCKYNEATDCVNRAISMSAPTAEYYLTLARIQRAQGLASEALSNVQKSLQTDPSNPAARTEKGLCLYDLGRYDDASTVFGEMIMDTPDEAMPYLLQAWVLTDGLKQQAKALPPYRRMLDAIPADAATPAALAKGLRGFALLFSGKKAEALAWAGELLKEKDTDGSRNYLAACLYAQAGDNDKALECASRSMQLGYSDVWNWTRNTSARVNVEPLRQGAALTDLMARYAYIFE